MNYTVPKNIHKHDIPYTNWLYNATIICISINSWEATVLILFFVFSLSKCNKSVFITIKTTAYGMNGVLHISHVMITQKMIACLYFVGCMNNSIFGSNNQLQSFLFLKNSYWNQQQTEFWCCYFKLILWFDCV